MGQLCSSCGSQDESKKSSAFIDTSASCHEIPDQLNHTQQHLQPSSSSLPPRQSPDLALNDHSSNLDLEPLDEKERERRLKQYQLEQAELARRESIVNAASERMIPVRSSLLGGNLNPRTTGGIYTYYDPAYASPAAHDILMCAARSGGLMLADDEATRAAKEISVRGLLPRPPPTHWNSKSVLETLGRGTWDGIKLGSRGSGVAGCGGEDPEYYLDDLAEAFLETVVPTKTTLFGGCPSIVENLL